MISAHAQLLGPIEIGENARVGASAVVTKDVPTAVTVVGVPAKIVRVHGPATPERDRAKLERERHVSFYDHMGGI